MHKYVLLPWQYAHWGVTSTKLELYIKMHIMPVEMEFNMFPSIFQVKMLAWLQFF